MHLTFILVKITLLNARVTSVRAVCCVARVKALFFAFFWGTFFIEDKRRSSTKDKRSRPCCQSADSSLPFSSAGTYIVFWRLFTLSLINKNGTKIRVDVEKIET